MNETFRQLKRVARRLMPAPTLGFLRLAPYYLLEHLRPTVRTEVGIPVPPLWKMFDGPRDKQLFLRNSEEVLEVYKKLGGLNPSSKILDIGSGLGRKTLSLPDFLAMSGRYIGVDIVRDGIDWCNENIATDHPNFIFLHLNVFNSRYNRAATVRASKYRFPFADSSFDLVAAWSVFTHMFPRDVENYLRETSRMLMPGGRCVFSFYIMTNKAIDAVKTGTAKERIEYELEDGLFTDNRNVPEDLTAFRESWIRTTYEAAGLVIENILYGSWSGDGAARDFPMTNYQDIVVARRA